MIAAILLFIMSSSASALELDRLAISYRLFHPSNRIPDLAGFKAKEGLTLDVDINLVGPLYWKNSIVAMTDDGGYKFIGWNFHFGAKVWSNLKLEYEHFSKHLIDHTDHGFPFGKFPVQDSIGFIWTIYSR